MLDIGKRMQHGLLKFRPVRQEDERDCGRDEMVEAY